MNIPSMHRHFSASAIMVVGLVALVALFAALQLQQPGTATAAGTILHVPGDATGIQAAIDLAVDGDEIQVQSGLYFEHLRITKSVKITGGWDITFTAQTGDRTRVNAGSGGRALTIVPETVGATVIISNFVFEKGNATGLGGVVTPTVGFAAEQSAVNPAHSDATTARAQTNQLRVQLVALGATGQFPGGQAALETALARIDAYQAQLQRIAPQAVDARAPFTPADEIDCGGGIYVRRAQLHLIMTSIHASVASTQTVGAGGGLCAVDMPGNGLVLEHVTMNNNTASTADQGFGGGLYFAGVRITATQSLTATDVGFRANTASTAGSGYGGGAFVAYAPGASLALAAFGGNVATANGQQGYGGGLYLADSDDVALDSVVFEQNTANTTLSFANPNEYAIGLGGALYLANLKGFHFTGADDAQAGQSIVVGNLGVFQDVGDGGAIFAQETQALEIDHVIFLDNLGAVRTGGSSDKAYGGAIHLTGDGSRIHDNVFRNNAVALLNVDQLELTGGALQVGSSRDIEINNNTFSGNYVSTTSVGGLTHGGGVDIGNSGFVTITQNQFVDNVAELGLSGGLGGALHFSVSDDVLVAGNTFIRNRAGTGAGIGGAVTIEGDAAGLGDFLTATAEQHLNNRVIVSDNVFQRNRAGIASEGQEALLGGALAINSTNGLALFNNILADNVAANGGAAALFGWDPAKSQPDRVRAALLTNNTIVGNPSGSSVTMEMWQTPITLTNNIIMSETVGVRVTTNAQTGGMVAAAYYNVYNDNEANSMVDAESTLTESNVITAPVAFVNRWQGDYHLLPTSSARDSGDGMGVPPAPPTDIEGAARPFGPAVDIGAFEWHGPRALLPQVMSGCQPVDVAGWAVGDKQGGYGVALQTSDGCHWQRIGNAALIGDNALTGVTAAGATNVWMVGEGGLILHSADGGQSWQRQTLPKDIPADAGVTKIAAISPSIVWAIAGDPISRTQRLSYILHTDDGGAHWVTQAQVNVAPGYLTSISAADAQNAWAVGARSESVGDAGVGGPGVIYHTADGGAHWLQQADQDSVLLAVKAISPNLAWAAGRGIVLRTTDRGVTWLAVTAPSTHDINRLFADDGKTIWAGIDDGNVAKTSNGDAVDPQAVQWASTNVGTMAYLMTVVFVDADRGWVVGTSEPRHPPQGGIFGTHDGGISWGPTLVPDNSGFWDLAMVRK